MSVRRFILGSILVFSGLTLGLAAPATGQDCPPDSVHAGTVCADKFEASVWLTTDVAVIALIRAGTVTLADLSTAGATQLGLAEGDLIANGCPNTGNGCTNVFAVSIEGVLPAGFVSWFQALAAARNSGKRLLTNAEWQAAALGTPGGAPCIVDSTGPEPTGTPGCVSDVGAFDMVGNVHEWVADWVPRSSACIPSMFPETRDLNCLAGATTDFGPGALYRGGGGFDFPGGSGIFAGVFAVDGRRTPVFPGSYVGFRAGR
jgi:hypothetical protein